MSGRADSRHTAAGFAPFVGWRRAMLPADRLAGLGNERAAALATEIECVRTDRERLSSVLLGALYAAVPRAAGPERGTLLTLRRDVFNDRPLRAPVDGLTLPPQARRALAQWVRLHGLERALRAQAETELSRELVRAGRTLAELGGLPWMIRGVQLTADLLVEGLADYREHMLTGSALPKRLRSVERTLTSLVYRAALKPSPYTTFTEVGLSSWVGLASWPDGEGPATSAQARSVVRSNRALLAWIADAAERAAKPVPWSQVRLNPTAVVRGPVVEFYVTGPDGSGEFRCVEVSEPIRDIIAELGRAGHAITPPRAGHGDEEVSDTVFDQLRGAGLLVPRPVVADREPRFAEALLAARPDGAPGALLRELVAAEDGLGTAAPGERKVLLDRVRAAITRLRAEPGVEAPPEEAVRTPVFETLVSRSGPNHVDPALAAEGAAAFDLLQRLLPLFDDGLLGRIGLLHYHLDRHGSGGEGVDVLELYRAFAGLAPDEAARLLDGVGVPDAGRIHWLRAWFGSCLEELLGSSGSDISLTAPWVGDVMKQFPEVLSPWPSATYLVQRTGEAGEEGGAAPRTVINAIRAGNGSFFARYSDAADDDQIRLLREAIHARNPRQADLNAVMGLNYNVHPALAPLEIVYPGAAVDDPNALSLRDLVVEPDIGAGRLRLRSKHDGVPVDLVPLNGLDPASGPGLYRFLDLFTSRASYRRGGLWNFYVATRSRTEFCGLRLPRITVGGFVLERRTWRFPVAEPLSALAGRGEGLGLLLAALRWRDRHGLPDEAFFRVLSARTPASGALRGRAHKPRYIDLTSVLLLRVLCRSLRSANTTDVVVIEECLPGPDVHRGPGGAEELALEHAIDEGRAGPW